MFLRSAQFGAIAPFAISSRNKTTEPMGRWSCRAHELVTTRSLLQTAAEAGEPARLLAGTGSELLARKNGAKMARSVHAR
jgi:hypothetical protein